MKNIYLTILILILSSCSKENPYKGYIGFWENVESKTPNLIQISKDNKTYLLTKFTFKENKKSAQVTINKTKDALKISEEQLFIVDGPFTEVIGLINDNKTLLISSIQYEKVSKERLNNIKNQMVENLTKKKENLSACLEFYKKKSDIFKKYTETSFFPFDNPNLSFQEMKREYENNSRKKMLKKMEQLELKKMEEIKILEHKYKDSLPYCDSALNLIF